MNNLYIALLIFLIFYYLYIPDEPCYYENFSLNDNDNVYVICLNNTVFSVAKKNLTKFFPNIKKFDAIKGADITGFDPTLISVSGYRSIFYDEKRLTHADLGSQGAVGCALSHATLWSRIKENEGMYIFESDGVCVSNPVPYVNAFLQTENPHILLFGSFAKSDPNINTRYIKKVNNRFFGMHGYYITYACAQILLKYLYPIEQQVDSYISDLLLLKDITGIELNIYIIDKGLCHQENHFGTSIQTKSVRK